MELDELEKCINSAEILYNTRQDKLDYVNRKMGYAGLQKDEMKGSKTVMFPGHKKDEIKHWKYYEVLRMMNSKTKERAQTISKKRFKNLINEHDFLVTSRPEIYRLANGAGVAKRYTASKGLWDLQFDIGKRIASLDETIYNLTIDPKHITYQLEQDEAYQEELNEQIRLFAQLT